MNAALVPPLAAAAAAPFSEYWPIDVIRVGVSALALWMAFLIARLLWVRHRGPAPGGFQRVHPAIMVSYLGFLVMSVLQRQQNLGKPPVVWLWVTLVILLVGAYGLVHRVGIKPPWRSRRGEDRGSR